MNVPIRRLLKNLRWLVGLAWLACQALAFATPMVGNLPFDMGWSGVDAQVQAVPGKSPAPLPPVRSPAAVSVAKPESPKTNVAATADSSPATGVLSVGPGDLLQVTVFGQPDMSAEVSVTEGGEVTLPLIGLIRIAGMAPSEVEKVIAQRLREREYLLKPEVSVTVRQNRSQAVSVLGEVVRPGRYPIQGRFTVLDLLAAAGGLTPKADSVVVLLRKGESGSAAPAVRIPIRLDRVTSPDRSPLDTPLNHDDMVYVGQQKFFYIHGEVRRPGSYPMEPDLDVMRALSISGGVTERGSMGRINIHRKSEGAGAQDFSPRLTDSIMDGDVIYVKERIF